MSSIAALLQAAEYLERREREVEHGYASSLPGPFVLDESYTQIKNQNSNGMPSMISSKRLKNSNNKKPQGNRSTHNELEKNRRAHLRNCLEKLKDIVPVGGDSSRHTTLGLLNKAKHFIKNLEDKERKTVTHRENLLREQRYLRRRLELLSTQVDAINKRRSVSECSTSTVSSSHSSHSESGKFSPSSYQNIWDEKYFKAKKNLLSSSPYVCLRIHIYEEDVTAKFAFLLFLCMHRAPKSGKSVITIWTLSDSNIYLKLG